MSKRSVKEHLTLDARMKVLEVLDNGKSERTVCEEFSIVKGSVARRVSLEAIEAGKPASIASKETLKKRKDLVLSPNIRRSREQSLNSSESQERGEWLSMVHAQEVG